MVLDLRRALNSLEGMPEAERKRYRVGRITQDIKCLSYKAGDVVLFESVDQQRTVTVASPLSQADIERHESQGHGFRTTAPAINVPRKYVEEIMLD